MKRDITNLECISKKRMKINRKLLFGLVSGFNFTENYETLRVNFNINNNKLSSKQGIFNCILISHIIYKR